MDIGVVLVTYNRLEKLKVSLKCYSEQTCQPSYVLVVDNCSTDGTDLYLDQWLSQKEQFEKEVYDKIVNPTKEECKKLRDNFKGSKKEKDKYYVDTLNKLYGERLTEHVNNSRYNITIRKVIL